jgi:tetratricopeptide (TPR) repeat protein
VQTLPGVIGDRYLFIPSLGFCLLVTYLIFSLFKTSLLTTKVKYSFGVILSIYSLMTFSRNMDWKDDLTLFRRDLKYADQSAQGHRLLAIHLIGRAATSQDANDQKMLREEAVVHLQKTLEIYPPFFNATFDLGRAYMLLNQYDSAIVYFKKASELNPSYTLSLLNIADIYMQQRKYRESVPYLEKAVRLQPKDYSGYDKLSFSLFSLSEFDKSIAINKKAIVEMPSNAEPYINLGRTFMGINQFDSARYYLLIAGKIAPGNVLVPQLLQQIDKK